MSSVLSPLGRWGGDGPAWCLCSLRPTGEEGWVSPPRQAGRWQRGLSGGGAAPGHQRSASERFRGAEHRPAWAPARTWPGARAREPLLPACHPPAPASWLCEPSPSPGWGSLPLLSSGSGVWGRELLVLRAGHVRGVSSVSTRGSVCTVRPRRWFSSRAKVQPAPPTHPPRHSPGWGPSCL